MATTTIVSHTYKLKRGKEDAVLNANPLLLAGEPIVVFRNDGSTNIKIGDGVTYYRDLPWITSTMSQADYEQNDSTAVDYIKNKPAIATDDDAMDFLAEMEMIRPVTNSNGEILISSSNEIYSL